MIYSLKNMIYKVKHNLKSCAIDHSICLVCNSPVMRQLKHKALFFFLLVSRLIQIVLTQILLWDVYECEYVC